MKDRTTAILLAFFLGGIGVHKFYLGRNTAGVLYLLFCWTLIPALLGFIDLLVLITTNDQTFHLTYNQQRMLSGPGVVIHNYGPGQSGYPAQPGYYPPQRDGYPQPGHQGQYHPQAGSPPVVSSPSGAPPAVEGQTSVADELVKLNELRIAGVLTDEEFRAHKQKLLSKP